MFKKLINKIKVIFKKQEDESDILKQPKTENIPDSTYNNLDFNNTDLAKKIGAFSYEYYKCNKYIRYLVLKEIYGEENIKLINILNRTKKFRVRKKLIKRIIN